MPKCHSELVSALNLHENRLLLPAMEFAQGAIELLRYLLPGFVAAWVYYGFTSHEKPSQFERTVQALIFTFFVQAIVAVSHKLMLWLGDRGLVLGAWDQEAELVWLVGSGLAFGLLIATLTEHDIIHTWARRWTLTRRASYASEWYEAICHHKGYVVLHLKDERRLFGYPQVWPSNPDRGHFLMVRASWLMRSPPQYDPVPVVSEAGAQSKPEGTRHGMNEPNGAAHNVEWSQLVDAADVQWVEFIQPEQSTK